MCNICGVFTAVLQAVREIAVGQGSDDDGELSVTWQLLPVNVTGYTIRYKVV